MSAAPSPAVQSSSNSASGRAPVVAIVGSTGPGAEQCIGPNRLRSNHTLEERFGRERALHDTKRAVADLVEEVIRSLDG